VIRRCTLNDEKKKKREEGEKPITAEKMRRNLSSEVTCCGIGKRVGREAPPTTSNYGKQTKKDGTHTVIIVAI
jgi:hypothetical protein